MKSIHGTKRRYLYIQKVLGGWTVFTDTNTQVGYFFDTKEQAEQEVLELQQLPAFSDHEYIGVYDRFSMCFLQAS